MVKKIILALKTKIMPVCFDKSVTFLGGKQTTVWQGGNTGLIVLD